MKFRFFLQGCLLAFVAWGCGSFPKGSSSENLDMPAIIKALPRQLYIENGRFHVQGVAVDTVRGYVYYSFTTSLIKTNLKGEIIGSVEGIIGHLGCLDINPEDGRIYASLEYKNDNIGKGILKGVGNNTGASAKEEGSFYIAIFDGEKIVKPGMDAEKDRVVNTVFLKDVGDDYAATVKNGGKQVKHRYGCSGIDGIAFGPQFGKKKGNFLNVSYGIYSDTARTDNDYQVILQYDPKDLQKFERPLLQHQFNSTGPDKPLDRFFVYTGNTRYGIQNLEYDPHTGYWFAAVYAGKKSAFPNYSLFTIDGSRGSQIENLQGFDNGEKGKVLQLAKAGMFDKGSGVYGWQFEWGATGMHSLGNGYFYISQNGATTDKKQYCKLQLYRWTGQASSPFEEVK